MERFLQSICQVRFDVDWDHRFVFGHCNTLQLGQKTGCGKNPDNCWKNDSK